ncbi:NUDIX hydrolase [Paracoccus aminophilus]|uniref:MutT/NUDIX family protein n=1 Tax=Paracoccus aminophilus JCM 7686 TaxID=1367847 RepID=S5YPK6_PARAH|nr:NUDIX hydrolase [Paracoccus aminophilus]AGT07246.1 MutT/NUDIX family protein [Paracoccus aminophilus JCM 7686]
MTQDQAAGAPETAPCHSASFHGAKLLLIHDGALLTALRDNFPHIPFPHHWDLPGGGREGGESPVACARRELFEEFGLDLAPARMTGRSYPAVGAPGQVSWFFRGEITAAEIAAIRFGEEGECWQMMPIADYLAHPKAVPHFKTRVRDALGL